MAVRTLLIFLFLFFFFAAPGFADIPNLGISTLYPLAEKEAVGGDIVSISGKVSPVLSLSKIPYDVYMYGVFVESPDIVMREQGSTGSAILRTGQANVNVTTMGGTIEVGDFITSSSIHGKGQRASDLTAGYMLGISLSHFDGKDALPITFDKKTYKIGVVQAVIGIGPASPIRMKAEGGVFGTLRQMFTAIIYNITISKTFEKLIRYIIAALVALITIYINFRTFGKNITKGIESIGRNPLAKAPIQGMIILNTVMIGVVSIAGIVLALVIISL